MSATKQRDHAIRIAPSDPEGALSQADDIEDPWFATQALSAVLRYGPEHRISVVCRRALARASECSDAYCRGAVLAWLVRALAERGHTSQATTVLDEAMRQALVSTPAGSRAEALFLLYQAAYPLGQPAVAPLFRHLTALQESSPHWRASRALVHALAMQSVRAPDSFSSIISSVRDARIARRVHRYIALGLTQPREFFGRH